MKPFSFGENWLQYSRIIDEARVAEAERSVQELLGRQRLDGLTLLDIGSGSALFAIAAVRLGASNVVAIDRDPASVAAGRQNVERFLDLSARDRIVVRPGDILEPRDQPQRYDVVYAWGSLHHTGSMWSAIDNASRHCAVGSLFVLAIYNKTWFAPAWLRIKQFYNWSPAPLRLVMAGALTGTRAVVRLAQFKHPLSVERGMTVWYDATDWLGGLPYECATPEEICQFMASRGGHLVRSLMTRRSGCNQFVFAKNA